LKKTKIYLLYKIALVQNFHLFLAIAGWKFSKPRRLPIFL